MSGFVPRRPEASDLSEGTHATLGQRPLSPAERRARWEVRAAQWRAREIAEAIFGRVSSTSLLGMRAEGGLRGLLRMDVPFDDLGLHRAREARFLSAAGTDPILSRVGLVYVLGPESV